MKSDRYTEAKEHAEFKRNKHSSKATADIDKHQPKADAWQERANLADDKRNDAQQKREKSVNDQLREDQQERAKKADDQRRDAQQKREKLADDQRDAQQKREKLVNDQLREYQQERAKKADDQRRNAQQKAEFKIKAKRLSEEGYPMPRPLDKTKRYVPHPNDRGSLDK